ncbi:hypothetical protein EYF80_039275 [Liparis tanakae]|uniref:Uncharacterized protein n=1 Tax=Liparis tanakae TaxID=230148 RepID=A0A4Z2GAA6_9TELE|nr:hypothetical protein EYF80_039275 [Liparis tanakae]
MVRPHRTPSPCLDGAGQAGVQGAVAVGVGVVHALLAHRVVVVFAVGEHALARRAHGARLAAVLQLVEEEVVVADAVGVVGVGAGRLHAHQAGALGAGPALLRHAVVLRVGLACRGGGGGGGEEERREGNEKRGKRAKEVIRIRISFFGQCCEKKR